MPSGSSQLSILPRSNTWWKFSRLNWHCILRHFTEHMKAIIEPPVCYISTFARRFVIGRPCPLYGYCSTSIVDCASRLRLCSSYISYSTLRSPWKNGLIGMSTPYSMLLAEVQMKYVCWRRSNDKPMVRPRHTPPACLMVNAEEKSLSRK